MTFSRLDVFFGFIGVLLWLALLWKLYLGRKARVLTTLVVGSAPIAVPKRRLLILTGLLEPTCEACKHWDYELGQESMKQFEAFQEATKYLSPEQIGVADEAAKGEHPWDITGPQMPAGKRITRWQDYGACQLHREGTHKGSSCKDYT